MGLMRAVIQKNSEDILPPTGNDSHLSLAERRPRRNNRQLPKRYRDIVAEPELNLPPPNSIASTSTLPPSNLAPDLSNNGVSQSTDANTHSSSSRIRKVFCTSRNIFGLVRKYVAEKLPTFDPDEHTKLEDLSSVCKPSILPNQSHDTRSFFPYPNENSFRLGHWYWNGGVQKSQESFRELLDIVGDLDFESSDVRHTNWNKINAALASNELESADQNEWEDVDAGWRKTPIKVSVPFHRRTADPGPREYVGADLYHRSLVDVIKEKVTDSHNAPRMHLDPYELLWKPVSRNKEVRVHGELYTSTAFLKAHNELQDSPGEPGCDLPRIVIGLMFSSDATHLTSFGQSKLWPCYLYVGNESKYRRCKPSSNLCSHVAYFQTVSWLFFYFI